MKTENQFPIELQDHATLMELKEKLKKDVMDPALNWQDRMNLYRTIQGINQQIQSLGAKRKN